jgi:hypothetical protein
MNHPHYVPLFQGPAEEMQGSRSPLADLAVEELTPILDADPRRPR